MSRPTRWLRRFQSARLATYLIALWKLVRHPGAPLWPRWIALAVLAYALSPIDLIPDFIPVLGQLDDLVLIPAGVAWVVRLTPRPVWAEVMRAAESHSGALPRLWGGALLLLVLWMVLLVAFVVWLLSQIMAGASAH